MLFVDVFCLFCMLLLFSSVCVDDVCLFECVLLFARFCVDAVLLLMHAFVLLLMCGVAFCSFLCKVSASVCYC